MAGFPLFCGSNYEVGIWVDLKPNVPIRSNQAVCALLSHIEVEREKKEKEIQVQISTLSI